MEALERAREAVNGMPPNLKVAKDALKIATKELWNDGDKLSECGEMYASVCEMNTAKEILKRAIELQPKCGPHKFLYLGQLCTHTDALICFKTALDILKEHLSHIQNDLLEAEVTRLQMSNACCSMAELYMTDLCDDENAEEMCVKYLDEAQAHYPNNPQALHAYAVYRKTVGEVDEAIQLSCECVKLLCKMLEVRHTADFTHTHTHTHMIAQYMDISIEFRLNLAKTLIDLCECVSALDVLHTVVDEDEEDVHAWYLMAVAYTVSKQDKDSAEKCLERAVQCALENEHTEEDIRDIQDLKEKISNTEFQQLCAEEDERSDDEDAQSEGMSD